MEARTATLSAASPAIELPAAAAVARSVAIAGCSLLAVGGLLVVARRAGGALVAPLPPGVLLACAGLLAAAAFVFRAAFQPRSRTDSRWTEYLTRALPSGVLLLWAIGLSAPGTGFGWLALWGVLLLEEGWSWGRPGRRSPVAAPAPQSRTSLTDAPSSAVTGMSPFLSDCEAPVEADEPDEAICQQVVRRRESDGSETIAGWLRAEVPAAARHVAAHVAICPPFEGLPQCFAEQMDGPPAQVKVAQVLPHGVRFEIKLDEPAAEASDVLVEFSIQYDGPK